MTQEALKLALEALEMYLNMDTMDESYLLEIDFAPKAITAIKKALAQTQEPVAYLCENAVGHKYFRWKKPSSTYKPIALYTTPPQRTEQPKVRTGDCLLAGVCASEGHKIQPQRTWVGLTNEEIGDEYVRFEVSKGGFNRFEYAVKAIEAKLKEKNT